MLRKRIAALGFAAAISACTALGASAEDTAAAIKADITQGSDTTGYEFTLNIYDESGNITKTIPVDADRDTANTLTTAMSDGYYRDGEYTNREFTIAHSNATLFDISSKYAIVDIELREDEFSMDADIQYTQIINLETGASADVSRTRYPEFFSATPTYDVYWTIKDFCKALDTDKAVMGYRGPKDFAYIVVDTATGEMIGDVRPSLQNAIYVASESTSDENSDNGTTDNNENTGDTGSTDNNTDNNENASDTSSTDNNTDNNENTSDTSSTSNTDNSTEDTANNNSDTTQPVDKGSADTGVEGLAVVTGAAVLAIGAAVLSRKKK